MRNSGGKAGNRGEPRGNPRREYRSPGKGGGSAEPIRRRGGTPERQREKAATTESQGGRPQKNEGQKRQAAHPTQQHIGKTNQERPQGGIEPPQQVNTESKEQRQPETELEEIERRLHMAAADIFTNIEADPTRVFLVRVSFIEIYKQIQACDILRYLKRYFRNSHLNIHTLVNIHFMA